MVKLVVGNLPPSATNQSLKEIFHEYTDLKDYKLISNYGFVYLETEDSAMHAVYNLNGIEYRGFQITVDYVGDSRNKRKLPAPIDVNQFPKATNPILNKPVQPVIEQMNPNPYNLPYPNGNNGMNRPSYNPQESRYVAPQPQMQPRNQNPYNLPYANASMGAARSFNNIPDRRYESQQYQDYDYNEQVYRATPYNNNYMPEAVPYGQSAAYKDYEKHAEHYIPEEEYFSNVPPAKRPRTNQFTDNSSYGYTPRQHRDYQDPSFMQFRGPRPNWSDNRQFPIRPAFLHPRDESFYRPRGKKVYQPNRSYIDEYEDDQDYGEIDPYPSYLKQYKK